MTIAPGPILKFIRWIRRKFWRLLWNILAVYGLLMLLFTLFFRVDDIISNSMSPTLIGDGKPGSDIMIGENITLKFRDPIRWEVVQFAQQDGLWVSKRVIALPGEKISIVDKKIRINGQNIPMPPSLRSREYLAYGSLRPGQEVDCENAYFVLGDDSQDSYDSRYEGVVSRNRIKYRSWLIISPGNRFGFINP